MAGRCDLTGSAFFSHTAAPICSSPTPDSISQEGKARLGNVFVFEEKWCGNFSLRK